MAEVTSAQNYFETLKDRFVATAAKGTKAVFQFELAGETGGTYHVAVDNDSMTWEKAAHAAPSVTIKMAAEDFVKMVNGKLNGQMAFMTGKMKIAGQIPLAMKMQSIFPAGKA
jgi:putative sterol carrier protein